jgi:hypothetical protein
VYSIVLSEPVRASVVTHFEIWAVSRISAVIDQCHRAWQSNGSAAHVARFVEPPGGAGSIAGQALRKQVALGRSWLFSLFFAAKYQPNQ